MQLLTQYPSPATIRQALFEDSSKPADSHLLALVLGNGSRHQYRAGKRIRKLRTATELAEALIEAAGGRLAHLVARVHNDELDFHDYGVGQVLGSRLIAALELAHRYAQRLRRGGNPSIRPDLTPPVDRQVLERRIRPTEGELIAILLDRDLPEGKLTRRLLAAYPSPAHLIATLEKTDFEAAFESHSCDQRHSASGIEMRTPTCCRLLAATEIARRHRSCARNEKLELTPAAAPDLVSLLDPSSPLGLELREELLATLRAKPERAADFAQLDRLAREALTPDHVKAIELHGMFETLIKRRRWTHPSEILGDPVPYPALLSIAQARIDAGARPTGRIKRIKEMLEAAEQERTKEPTKAFVEVLLDLDLSEPAAKKAFAEARRLYFEPKWINPRKR